MKISNVIWAGLLTAVLAASSVAPVSAALIYNSDLNIWEQVNERPLGQSARSRRSSAVKRELVSYQTKLKPGSLVVETSERRLYLVLGEGKALRYGIGVGREGFAWAGTNKISRKAEWPGWTPPAEMRQRVPDLPTYMPGGPDNPLGARALYIGSTLYRVHGTSEPWTIGQAVSSGCIRLTNEDVTDLYERVKVGATIVVNQ